MLTAVFVAVALVIVCVLLYMRPGNKNPPPGPRGLPLVGSVLSLDWQHQERTLQRWGEQYGPIYQIHVGPDTWVVLGDADLVREALSKPVTAGRVVNGMLKLFYADKGIVFSSGELWHHTRRFTLHHLRNFGMGKSQLEAVIADQAAGFVSGVVAPSAGKAMSLDKSLNVAIMNVIWYLVAGESVDIKDTRILDIMSSVNKLIEMGGRFLVLIAIPVLRHLPYCLTGLDKVLNFFFHPVNELVLPAIEQHRRTVDLSGEPNDFIDCLLQEQSRDPQLFSDKHLIRCCMDLFFAGVDTTSTTLRWAFCFLCNRPDVQERIYQELYEVVGEDRAPTLADRPRLPYTEAFLLETQRRADIIPGGLPHVATEDFTLGGYSIPRDTVIIPLLAAVHNDPTHFPEPAEFRPERFLDADGKLQPNKAAMPFSVGKRSCVGEAIARAELFLFVTAVVQKFRLRFPDGFHHDLSINESRALVIEPLPYSLIPEAR